MSQATEAFDVDFSKAGQLGNKFLNQLDELREIDPIHWSDASQCWIVTRHADIVGALRDEFPFSMDRLPQIAFMNVPEADRATLYPNMSRYMSNWIINANPPAHTRLRKLLMKAFSRKMVEAMQPFVRERVAELISKLKDQPEIEFNEEIARILPGSVMLDMIGLPQAHRARLKYWADAFVQGIGVPFATADMLQSVEDAIEEINNVLMPELKARRTEPREDLLTALVQANDEGDKLSLEEMLGALHVLIVAGHDSTANTMTLMIAALSEHPAAWEYMYRNPERMQESVLELMRYIAMSASQPRIVARDFDWHGKHLKQGEVVFLMLAGGNRDPRKYDNPDQLDLQRNNDESLVFAPGVHHCIGHLLAKQQLTEFFSALVREFEGVEVLDERLKFMHQLAFRGLSELNVRMLPRQVAAVD
jgi:cytochrome P450